MTADRRKIAKEVELMDIHPDTILDMEVDEIRDIEYQGLTER